MYQEATSVLELIPLRLSDDLVEKFFISLYPIHNIKKVFSRSLSPRINSQHKLGFHLRPKMCFMKLLEQATKMLSVPSIFSEGHWLDPSLKCSSSPTKSLRK